MSSYKQNITRRPN